MANYNVRPKPGAVAKKHKAKAAATPGQSDAQTSALEQLYGQTGVQAGEELINKYLQPGSLGRMGTEASADQLAAMEKMKAGLGGYTSPEYQASREQMQRGLNSNLATSLSQLAKGQARGKVYGAAATAQQGNQLRSAQDTKDNMEQDLMVKNIDEQRSRLGDYSTAANGLESQRRDAEKVNLGQQDAEISSRINALTGMGGQALLKAQLEAAQKISKRGRRDLSR